MAPDDDSERDGASREKQEPGEDMDWVVQQQQDDVVIHNLFNDPTTELEINLDGPIDQSGKADDAEDFEDISDGDLPEEDEGAGNVGEEQPPALVSDGGTSNDNDDDLFGERESSPLQTELPMSPGAAIAEDDQEDVLMRGIDVLADLRRLNFDPEPSYPMANQDMNIPSAPENILELLKQTYPEFERGKILNFNELFPPRKANWVDKKPTRNPKPLVPTKLNLDLDLDQEKLFRIPGSATSTRIQKIQTAEKNGLVSLLVPEPIDEDDLEIFPKNDQDSDSELIGGFTLRDIETVCEDWEDIIDPPSPLRFQEETSPLTEDERQWYAEMGINPPKPRRRKLEPPNGLPEISRFSAPSFDNFEEATARSAKRARLDLSDPYLLIDDQQVERPVKRAKPNHKMIRMADGSMAVEITSRFDISNDEAYEALKEAGREKVRATLGGVQVEHSLPARRLLYPYYQVKLPDPNPFNYHRPSLHVREQVATRINWARPRWHKRRELKGQRAPEIYKKSVDLSLNDNSTAVLFEYCEEIPTVLSNFGMGSKIVNYFRVHHDAEEKPPEKPSIGETKILLPEDRSPFANFGNVKKGEMVPALWNQMYRAPIFKHEPRKTDFIIGRITDEDSSRYYLRKIDHIYVVGQNFPSVEIPGPHSRKVTNTSKNRMKMLSYRLITRHGSLSLEDITTHIRDSNIAQNRQKLKEFLHYDKDHRVWELREGERMMDPETVNGMVQPEDVCLVDAMQVGSYEMEKAGFAISDVDKDDDKEDANGNPNSDNVALQLAPWKTTKAFLDATSGKAMLKLRGEGDPTGRGLGFSFIRTSMKGGFLNVYHEQGPQSTSADALERERKANGGHSYNVKKQNDAYAEVIAEIWGKQKETLSDPELHDDADVQFEGDEDDRLYANGNNAAVSTPNAAAPTPRFDEGASQISRSAISARQAKKKLRIIRMLRRDDDTEYEQEEIITDPGVIQEYITKRREQAMEDIDVYNVSFTGDPEHDEIIYDKLRKEEERLKKNSERREQREKQKSGVRASLAGASSFVGSNGTAGSSESAMSPGVEPSVEKGGTTRKCANCGQVGHIKTNKKLCPKLNGTMGFKTGTEEASTGAYGES